jgi:hypothetical protein
MDMKEKRGKGGKKKKKENCNLDILQPQSNR